MTLFFIFLIGLCFGSFVTMASHRLPRGEEILITPSHCPQCNHKLCWRDLFPVISWLLARGKCRYCGVKVSWRYPLIELLCGALFVGIALRYGLTPQAGFLALFATALLTLLIADLETYLIPDALHFVLLPLGISYHLWRGTPWQDVALCAALALLVGLVLHYGYYWLRGRHGLGLGDVKFLPVAAVWLGNPLTLVVFFVYSGLCGIVFGLVWRRLTRQPYFPFAPALAISLFLLVIFPEMAEWFWQGVRGLLGAAF